MRRLPFITGLLTLAGATAFLAAGRSIALFIVGRILQGMSAAIVWVVGLSVIVDTVGQKNVGQFMGYVSIAMSLGLLIAPLLGGIVFDQAGYMAVFAMCFGLLGVDVVLRLLMIERKVAKKWIPSLDSRKPSISNLCEQYHRDRPGTPRTTASQKSLGNGRSRSTSGTLCGSRRPSLEDIQLAPIQPARTASIGEPRDTGHCRNPSVAEAANRILSDKPSQASARRPFSARLPPVITLLASRRLLAALWASLVQATLLTAFDSTLPIRVRNIFGWDSLGAGLIFLPVMIPTFISPLLGWISDRYGNKWLCAVGFLTATPFLVLLRLVDHNNFTQKAILCVLLFFFGLTITLAFAPLMAEITYVVEAKERKAPPGTYGKYGAYAQAYGLFNVFFAGGCLVGPIWGGMIKDASDWGTMCWTLGLLSGLTALPCLIWTGGFITTTWRVVKKPRGSMMGPGDVAEEPRPRLPRLDGNTSQTLPNGPATHRLLYYSRTDYLRVIETPGRDLAYAE